MICPGCGGKCRCVDSRPRLGYGVERPGSGVRERKYICPKCGEAYFTVEELAGTRKVESSDMRLTEPKGEE